MMRRFARKDLIYRNEAGREKCNRRYKDGSSIWKSPDRVLWDKVHVVKWIYSLSNWKNCAL